MGADTYTRNIEIRDLPVRTNNILNTLAKLRGVNKAVIVRESLEEYAKNHMNELSEFAAIPDNEDD